MRESAYVCGVPVSACTLEEVLAAIGENISGRRKTQVISITNTESMYFALRRETHRAYIESAAFSLCDGMGVVMAGLFQGARIPRVNGPILLQECCRYGAGRGWRHFFYGGKPGVPESVSSRLTARFPGMITAGVYSPPFRPSQAREDDAVLEWIRGSRPDIVWVALGLLKQEQWVEAHAAKLGAPWVVGVGAAFDYHAGTAKWAPPWIRRAGFEWLYRLLHEPRMLKRNLRSFLFLGEACLGGAVRSRSGDYPRKQAG